MKTKKIKKLEALLDSRNNEMIAMEAVRREEHIRNKEFNRNLILRNKELQDESERLWEDNGRLIIKVADLQAQKDKLIDIIKRLKLEVLAGEEELANMAAYYNSEIAKANEDLSFKMHNLMTLTDNYEESERENKECYKHIAELEHKLGEAHTTNTILLSQLSKKN